MNKRRWTETDEIILKERYPVEGDKALAEILGRTRKSIRLHAHRMGIKVKPSVNEEYFSIWTPNMAYTLGYIYADGHINKNGNTLVFRCHSKDEEIIVKILTDMKCTNKIHHRASCVKNGRNYGPETSVMIGSIATVRKLQGFGLVHNKTYQNLPFPDVPEKFLRHFIRGYFDGDGCISIREERYFTFTLLATKKFAEEMQCRISAATGIKPRMIWEQKNIYFVCWAKLEYIKILAEWLYPSGDYIYLTRKRTKLESAHQIVPRKHG